MAQLTPHLLMIRPVNFAFNELTAGSNRFQKAEKDTGKIQDDALKEFDLLAGLLKENDLDVTVLTDTATPPTPDSVFPNNWISFIDGKITLYPMLARNRRDERRPDIIQYLSDKWMISELQDLTYFEDQFKFLEGTGSIVPDRENRIAYACLSPRTDADVLNEFCRLHKYRPVTFQAFDDRGNAIYHTNVMMCVGENFAVICLDAVPAAKDRSLLERTFGETNKEMIRLSVEQMNAFAGNMLEVINRQGEKLLILSERAFRSLTGKQVARLEKHARLVHTPLETIENNGGGSARCMIAEIFPQ